MQSWSGVSRRLVRNFILGVGGVFSLASMGGNLPVLAAEKSQPGKVVDSGSFGVFVNGKRVATETFSIHQDDSGSSITSEFKTESGENRAVQTSDLQLAPSGELKGYEWKEVSPGQSHAIVMPKEQFLLERYSKNPQDKPMEQPFLLPTSTSILDDYFYIQREVLAWKYLATSCKQEGGVRCPLKESTQMGTLNAHTRASSPVSVEFAGREKVTIRGSEHELIRLDMRSDVGDWTVWLNDELKLQRIVDPGNGAEVVRD
jgi:hypothetical protein